MLHNDTFLESSIVTVANEKRQCICLIDFLLFIIKDSYLHTKILYFVFFFFVYLLKFMHRTKIQTIEFIFELILSKICKYSNNILF